MKNTNLLKAWAGLTIVVMLVVFSACKRNAITTTATPAENSPSQTSEPAPGTNFKHDLQYVRNSQFTYVWIFSRKDGRPLDKDDGAFLKANAPQVIDWVKTDEGKKYIAGTNFDLELGNMNLLKKRFVVEDYSGK
jgi:hypothetical protein